MIPYLPQAILRGLPQRQGVTPMGLSCLLFKRTRCCRQDRRNPPIHHCRHRVRFANIRRSTTDYHLAGRFGRPDPGGGR